MPQLGAVIGETARSADRAAAPCAGLRDAGHLAEDIAGDNGGLALWRLDPNGRATFRRVKALIGDRESVKATLGRRSKAHLSP